MIKAKKLISMVLVGGVLLSSLVGCGNAGSNSQNSGSSDVIKIGGIAPLTGDVAVYGVAANNGAKLAIEEINANGGLLGKQIEYVAYDDKGDPTEAVNAYKKLTSNDKVEAILGAVTSKPTMTVTP